MDQLCLMASDCSAFEQALVLAWDGLDDGHYKSYWNINELFSWSAGFTWPDLAHGMLLSMEKRCAVHQEMPWSGYHSRKKCCKEIVGFFSHNFTVTWFFYSLWWGNIFKSRQCTIWTIWVALNAVFVRWSCVERSDFLLYILAHYSIHGNGGVSVF